MLKELVIADLGGSPDGDPYSRTNKINVGRGLRFAVLLGLTTSLLPVAPVTADIVPVIQPAGMEGSGNPPDAGQPPICGSEAPTDYSTLCTIGIEAPTTITSVAEQLGMPAHILKTFNPNAEEQLKKGTLIQIPPWDSGAQLAANYYDRVQLMEATLKQELEDHPHVSWIAYQPQEKSKSLDEIAADLADLGVRTSSQELAQWNLIKQDLPITGSHSLFVIVKNGLTMSDNDVEQKRFLPAFSGIQLSSLYWISPVNGLPSEPGYPNIAYVRIPLEIALPDGTKVTIWREKVAGSWYDVQTGNIADPFDIENIRV